MGLLGKVARFASSPQGRRMVEQAKDAAARPENKQKIENAVRGLRRKGGQPPR